MPPLLNYTHSGSSMIYTQTRRGVFLQRHNRFIAEVELDSAPVICHVKNTGRCRELLLPGVEVSLSLEDNPRRLTAYDLIAVRKGERWINIDSQLPNKAFHEYLLQSGFIPGITRIKAEAKYGNSRFDFYVETDKQRIFIEVKGVTLEQDNMALFPDAPTERGAKHLRELTACVAEGYTAMVVFVVQINEITGFMPNEAMDPVFSSALREACASGVNVQAFECLVTENTMMIAKQIPVLL